MRHSGTRLWEGTQRSHFHYAGSKQIMRNRLSTLSPHSQARCLETCLIIWFSIFQ
ncbi:unnamed protein product [Arabidopsis halleri]